VTATRRTIVKLGGELLEPGADLRGLTRALAVIAAEGPLVVVHGGGKEIDAECARRGIAKVAVDGLRVTDAATLDAVVTVLSGAVNTRLVAALAAAGTPAVGLTGADASCVLVEKAAPHHAVDGRVVDLGLVGTPIGSAWPGVLDALIAAGTIPVVACVGIDASGQLYNVNADTMAAHLAGVGRARRLIIGGTVAGVLDATQALIAHLDPAGIDALVADGTASAGMVAKLTACRRALDAGVDEISIVDARTPGHLVSRTGTRISRSLQESPS
jgi:acetylglutamate kinase